MPYLVLFSIFCEQNALGVKGETTSHSAVPLQVTQVKVFKQSEK